MFEQQEEAAEYIAAERVWPCEGTAGEGKIVEVVEQDCRCIGAVAGRVFEVGHTGYIPWEGTCCHYGMVRSFGFVHMAHSYHKHYHMRHHRMVGIDAACLGFGNSLAGSCMLAVGVVDMAFPDLEEHTLAAAVADLGHCAAGLVLFLLQHPEAAAIWEALFSAGRESAAGSVLQTERVGGDSDLCAVQNGLALNNEGRVVPIS